MRRPSFAAAVLTQDPELRARVTSALELAGAVLRPSPNGADVAVLDLRLPVFRSSLSTLTERGTWCVGVSAAAPSGEELVELLAAGLAGWVDAEVSAEELARELTTTVATARDAAGEPAETPRDAVRRVIAERAFSIVVHPVCDLAGGDLLAVEARARFHRAGGRTPLQWLALAEEAGLRADLEIALAGAALQGLADLPSAMSLLVNVSAEALPDPRLGRMLAEHDADRVILKLSRHHTLDAYESLSEGVAAARRRGTFLAIDDSGAGLHSLAQLAQLRPDFLTLHGALVRHVDREPVRRALARALVSFAGEIGAEVIAEGIETAAELEALCDLGVRLGQGHLLAPPSRVRDLPSSPLRIPTAADAPGSGAGAALPREAEGDFLATAHAVIRLLRAEMPNDSAVVSQLDYASRRVGVIAVAGPVSSLLQPGVALPQEETPEHWLAAGKAPRVCDDVRADPVYGALRVTQHPGFTSIVGTPLELIDGTRVGALTVVSGRRGAFGPRDLALLEELALALERALLDETSGMDRAELTRYLRSLAQMDGVTGVLSPAALREQLADRLGAAPPEGTHRYLVRLELDGMRDLIEHSGRAVGDLALRSAAAVLREGGAPGDVIGRAGRTRLGALLVGRTDPADAERYVEFVRARVAEMVGRRGWPITVRCDVADPGEVAPGGEPWGNLMEEESALL